MRKEFIPPKIQRPDDNRAWLEGGSDLAIGQELFLLRRERLAIDEQILGTIEANSFRAAGEDRFSVAGLLHVCRKDDALAIESDRRFVVNVTQLLFQRDVFADKLAVFKKGLVGRIDNDQTIESIEQGVLSILQLTTGVLQTHYCRDAHRPGHDGRMRGFTPDISCEAKHHFLIQLSRARGRQVVADDDARFFDSFWIELIGASQQVVQDTGGDIAHIRCPLAQILIVNGAESFGVLVSDLLKSVLGADFFLKDDAADLFDQSRVFKDEEVGIKDGRIFGSQGAIDLALHIENLAASLDEGLLQTLSFMRQIRLAEVVFLDFVVLRLAQKKDLTPTHPRRNGDASNNLLSRPCSIQHATLLTCGRRFEKRIRTPQTRGSGRESGLVFRLANQPRTLVY